MEGRPWPGTAEGEWRMNQLFPQKTCSWARLYTEASFKRWRGRKGVIIDRLKCRLTSLSPQIFAGVWLIIAFWGSDSYCPINRTMCRIPQQRQIENNFLENRISNCFSEEQNHWLIAQVHNFDVLIHISTLHDRWNCIMGSSLAGFDKRALSYNNRSIARLETYRCTQKSAKLYFRHLYLYFAIDTINI